MQSKIYLWVGLVVVIGAAAFGAYRFSGHKDAVSFVHRDFAVAATPAGITLEPTGAAAKFGAGPLAYADAKGMTLYTYDKDTEAGKSACADECAKGWPPALAPANAQAAGDWSIVARADGSRQWAFKGKPLYAHAADKGIGDISGNGADMVWHTAMYEPASGVTFPDGIALKEIPDANGQALTDDRGMALYTFDGDPNQTNENWTPFVAAEIANPVGDFSIVSRPDGQRQWAYKGNPLFTFNGDMVAGEAHGADADKNRHVALLQRYFTPSDLTIQHAAGQGDTMANANGLTLYRRDAKGFQPGGHGLAGILKGIPATGRAIGINGCDADCQKTFHPFHAPADAQPSGYWAVANLPDGSKQWVYKGYALYTYDGDKKPGDITGHDIYDILVNDGGLHKTAYPALPAVLQPLIATYSLGLYWTYAAP